MNETTKIFYKKSGGRGRSFNRHKVESLRRKWGPWLPDGSKVTVAELDEMYRQQDGRCCICGCEDNSLGRLEMICDDNGKLVGLLCIGCIIESKVTR